MEIMTLVLSLFGLLMLLVLLYHKCLDWSREHSDKTAIVNAAIALYNHRNPRKRRIEDEMHLESALDEAVRNYLNNQKGEIHVN